MLVPLVDSLRGRRKFIEGLLKDLAVVVVTRLRNRLPQIQGPRLTVATDVKAAKMVPIYAGELGCRRDDPFLQGNQRIEYFERRPWGIFCQYSPVIERFIDRIRVKARIIP